MPSYSGKALWEELRGVCVRVGAAGSIAVLTTLAGSALAARAATESSYQVLVGDGLTGTVFVVAAGSAAATAIPPPIASGVASLAVSPDGSRVYVAFKDGELGIISTASDSYVGAPVDLGSSSSPGQMVVTPDGADLYVAETGANQVVEVDIGTNTLVGTPIAIAAPVNLAISPDGATLFVDGGSQTSGISLIPTSSNAANATTIPLAGAGAMVVSPDGSSLYVFTDASTGPAVTAIDTATGVVGSGVALPNQGQPPDLAVAPDGSAVYLPDGAGQSLYVLGMTYFVSPSSSPPAPSGLPLGFAPSAVAITPDGGIAYLGGTTSTNTPEVVGLDLTSSTLASPILLPAGAQPSGLVIAQVAVTPTPTPTPNPSPTPTPSPTCRPFPVIPLGPGPISVPPNQPVPASSPSAGAGSGRSGTGSVAGSAPTPPATAPPMPTTAPSEGTLPPVGTNTPTPDPSPSFCCGVGIVEAGGSTSGGPTTTVPTPIATPPGVTASPTTANSPGPVTTSSPVPVPATPTPSAGTGHLPIFCFAPAIGGPAFPGAAALTRGVAEPVAGGPILPAALALLGLGGVGVVIGARRRGFLTRLGRVG